MSPRLEILEIARRELLERWRSRTMRISFAILIALVVAAAVAAALSHEGKPTDDFGLVGPRAATLAPALRLADQVDERKTSIHRLRDRAAAERAVLDGEVDVAIVDGRLLARGGRARMPRFASPSGPWPATAP